MDEMDGSKVYALGEEYMISDPRIGKEVHVRAVKPIKDGDFCCGCYFETYCHSCKGLSEIGFKCYTIIFEKVTD